MADEQSGLVETEKTNRCLTCFEHAKDFVYFSHEMTRYIFSVTLLAAVALSIVAIV